MKTRRIALLVVAMATVALAIFVVVRNRNRSQPDRIEVSPKQLAFTARRQSAYVVARLIDRAGRSIQGAQVTYASSDPKVATVEADGLVKAVEGGVAKITVTSAGLSDQVDVDVRVPGKLVMQAGETRATVVVPVGKPAPLEPAIVTVDEGDDIPVQVQILDMIDRPMEKAVPRQQVLDTSIAAFSKDGKTLAGKRRGIVAAEVDFEGLFRPFTVVVLPVLPVPAPQVNKMVLRVGETQHIMVGLKGDKQIYPPTVFTYSSSNDSVAPANIWGQVTGLSPGKATVSVTLEYATATVDVTVLPDMKPFQSATGAPVLIATPNKVSMKVGETKQLTAALKGGKPLAPESLTFWSTSPNVAVVNTHGQVYAQQAGTTMVGVSSGDSKAPVEVTVLPVPQTLATAGKRTR